VREPDPLEPLLSERPAESPATTLPAAEPLQNQHEPAPLPRFTNYDPVKAPDLPYQPTEPAPAPHVIVDPREKWHTAESREAAHAARRIQQLLSREEARLTPRARYAMLCALHEALTNAIAAHERGARQTARVKTAIAEHAGKSEPPGTTAIYDESGSQIGSTGVAPSPRAETGEPRYVATDLCAHGVPQHTECISCHDESHRTPAPLTEDEL